MMIDRRLILLLGLPRVVLICLGIYTHQQLDRIDERGPLDPTGRAFVSRA